MPAVIFPIIVVCMHTLLLECNIPHVILHLSKLHFRVPNNAMEKNIDIRVRISVFEFWVYHFVVV